MVKDQLESLTLLRMALDVGSAMQYLAEANFVVRHCSLICTSSSSGQKLVLASLGVIASSH